MTTTKGSKATRGKLERALIQLENFAASNDLNEVLTHAEERELASAIAAIQKIESRLFNEGR